MNEEFIKQANRLIMMIDAANLQATMIKGTPELRQRVKQLFSPFFDYGIRLSKHLKYATGDKEADYELEAAFVLESLIEICDSKNKIEALAVLRMYNEGKMVIIDD